MVSGGGGLGRRPGHESGALRIGSVPYNRHTEGSLVLFSPSKDPGEGDHLQPGGGRPCWHPELRPPGSKTIWKSNWLTQHEVSTARSRPAPQLWPHHSCQADAGMPPHSQGWRPLPQCRPRMPGICRAFIRAEAPTGMPTTHPQAPPFEAHERTDTPTPTGSSEQGYQRDSRDPSSMWNVPCHPYKSVGLSVTSQHGITSTVSCYNDLQRRPETQQKVEVTSNIQPTR
nr:uncharacterized protein LOC129136160 [Pan troglodytes]